jgi:hypothetical protein
MGLGTKIQKSVDKAFAAIDDVLVPVIFSNKASNSFDFSAGVVTTTDSVYSTRAFQTTKKSYIDGSSVVKTILIMKTAGIVFNGYTTVDVNGTLYSCCTLESDQYVTTIELTGVA